MMGLYECLLVLPSVLDVPTGCSEEVQGYADDMIEWLNQLTVDSEPHKPQKHDHSKPCLICKKTGHSFKGCKVLNDHEFLKLAFIKTCLYFSSLHRAQSEIQVHELIAALRYPHPASIKRCLYFSSLHRAQSEIQIHELCAHLNMDIPDDDTYVHIWEHSQKDQESQDFCEAKETW